MPRGVQIFPSWAQRPQGLLCVRPLKVCFYRPWLLGAIVRQGWRTRVVVDRAGLGGLPASCLLGRRREQAVAHFICAPLCFHSVLSWQQHMIAPVSIAPVSRVRKRWCSRKARRRIVVLRAPPASMAGSRRARPLLVNARPWLYRLSSFSCPLRLPPAHSVTLWCPRTPR